MKSVRSRQDLAVKQEAKYASILAGEIRKEKLLALYRSDDKKHENELNALGLSFKKERP